MQRTRGVRGSVGGLAVRLSAWSQSRVWFIKKKVYVYTTTLKTVVNKSEVQYIYDEPGKKMITLVTCASGEDGEVDRTIIQGELAEVLDATKENLKYFN